MNGSQITKQYWLIGTILILIASSWIGFIDKYANNYTHSSILQAGGAYAISRGLNSAISVAQTSTIQGEVGFLGSIGGSIAIGEVLDPLNDLIERFSEIVTIALGSLALQTILLEIASNTLFKVAVTLSGISVIALFLLKKMLIINQASRVFILLVFIRFSFAIVLSLNALFDYAFTHEKIEQNKRSMEFLEAEVKESNENKEELNAKISDLNEKIESTKEEKQDLHDDLNSIQSDIKELEQVIDDKISKMDFTEKVKCKTAGICPENILELKSDLEKFQDKEDKLSDSIKSVDEKIEEYQDKVSENEQILSGDIPWSMSITNASASISKIQNNFANGISNIINLLMLFILKTVLLPIVFLYGLIKFSKMIWNNDWREIIALNPASISNVE